MCLKKYPGNRNSTSFALDVLFWLPGYLSRYPGNLQFSHRFCLQFNFISVITECIANSGYANVYSKSYYQFSKTNKLIMKCHTPHLATKMKIHYNNPPAVLLGVFRESEVIMCIILERVVQFLYEILQWWSGWWYTSGGQQETRLLQPRSTVLIQGALVIVQQEVS